MADGVNRHGKLINHVAILTLGLLALLWFAVPVPAAAQVVREGEVRRVVEEYLLAKTAGLGCETTVKKVSCRGDVNLPDGPVEYEVIAPRQWEGWGKANLALVIRVNGRVEKNIPVTVEVEALASMVVTLRSLDRGEVVGGADVTIQRRDLGVVSGKIYAILEDVVGKRLRVGVRANTPLRADSLEKVPLVKSGQTVTIIVENDFLRLTASGKTRSAGAEGDTVVVQNSLSNREMPARVIDASTVKVDF